MLQPHESLSLLWACNAILKIDVQICPGLREATTVFSVIPLGNQSWVHVTNYIPKQSPGREEGVFGLTAWGISVLLGWVC